MITKWKNHFAFAAVALLIAWTLYVLSILPNPITSNQPLAFTHGNVIGIRDFVHFYQAGWMAKSPQRTQVYDAAVQLEFTNRLIKPNHIERAFYIQYVPYIFPLMVPLTLFNMQTAFNVWYALSLIVGSAGLLYLLRQARHFSLAQKTICYFAIVSSPPSVIALSMGQSSWFLLGFLCLLYAGLKHRRDLLGGAGLALLTIKFQYLPLFLVATVAGRRWKLITAGLITGLLLLVPAGMTIGWENVYRYPFILLQAETLKENIGVHPESMVSIRGLLTPVLPQQWIILVSIALLSAAGYIVYKLWRAVSHNRFPLDWAMSFTTVSALALSPHCHQYDLLLLSLPAILTLPTINPAKILQLPSAALRLWSLILIVYPFAGWLVFCLKLPAIFALANLVLLLCGGLHVTTLLKESKQIHAK